ncbi:UDP-N-acetylglucosamine 2-epimerase [Akkermansiaceae bacterium]|nr:UDP-N-acetylglucosamine 2-epimerase [Akkermansiaceae bacterium]MDB4311133.1 UDP-N-acetylglucosamine 2-epimerase [bacterium]MDB4286944.1 UDP-N-acetylglucosamine 2-epimerase [Akkermansiaceae bacterium]MDB4312426.1 UDP-N-acetylglucosamine 2-epimerase [bacterium]MDB4313377.1 UDP-N-acetylglucosamine 2-epimerase [bacterium]
MRKIGLVTVGRSDYGTCRRLLKALAESEKCEAWLYVAGAHLSELSGNTVSEIEADGFEIRERVEMVPASDRPGAIASSVGEGMSSFASLFEKEVPDILVVVGDRTELLAVVSAALPFRIPVAHLSGGEISEGATDDMVRHAVTKLSHIHFPTNEQHGERVCQLGEEASRVYSVGDPALDRLSEPPGMDRRQLEESLGIKLVPPVVVVTHHPLTQGAESNDEVDELIAAMSSVEATWVITFPNADRGAQGIIDRFRDFAAENQQAVFLPSLGQERYYSLLGEADGMLGNSSSGIWESASFELPVVNVGDRQKGRMRERNVLDSVPESGKIERQLKVALGSEFRAGLKGLKNPYGAGNAAKQIVKVLENLKIDEALLRKPFVDWKK